MTLKSAFKGKDAIRGSFVKIDQDDFYKIENLQLMDEFLITLASDSDHWMFVSSRGAVTCGRKNVDMSLFPYDTVDKLYASRCRNGTKTAFRIRRSGSDRLWVPWSDIALQLYDVRRNLYKNTAGCEIIFEEVNPAEGLSFRYKWSFSRQFGFVKKAWIENLSGESIDISLMDGFTNVISPGITRLLLEEFGSLTDAYKYNVIHPAGLAIFNLASGITDRAEPREMLRATVCWQCGLDSHETCIDGRAFQAFLGNTDYPSARATKGLQSDYYLRSAFGLAPGESVSWHIIADVGQSRARVDDLIGLIETAEPNDLQHRIQTDCRRTRDGLMKIIGMADGSQITGDRRFSLHHHANTLFNVMRGGVFPNHYIIDVPDFMLFLKQKNSELFGAFSESLKTLGDKIPKDDLVVWAKTNNHPSLARLALEYLPLQFSRRHGDPSRPWNNFSIDIEDNLYRPVLDYQGNWRDTFQNWEALGMSFPGYYRNFVAKFLNAITPDGYNPYRISRRGFEWEVVVPGNPWSNIGYWQDHQIIYVQKLFEWEERFFEGLLDEDMTEPVYSYANVPYRIRAYEDILENPRKTIDFDYELHEAINEKIPSYGSDAALIMAEDGVYLASLLEKILILFLAKISNLVPDGGIWLNTQRPEWNDANNALPGFGLSMVTLYYLRRFVRFWCTKCESRGDEEGMISSEIVTFSDDVRNILRDFEADAEKGFSGSRRKAFMDAMGNAAHLYRQKIYRKPGFSGKSPCSIEKIADLFSASMGYIEKSIENNKRPDGLYHAYNLLDMDREKTKADLRRLAPMLEGQVAVISSGAIESGEVLALLSALKSGPLFRKDQYSYLLYPDKDLPDFFAKNRPDPHELEANPLIRLMLEKKDYRIIERSKRGSYSFHPDLTNKDELAAVFSDLERESLYADLAARAREHVFELYEKEFLHRESTGRSSGMFAYEGLGSIYWHMVSKLLLAVQEHVLSEIRSGKDPAIVARLKESYFDIRAGLGYQKEPGVYGAFPCDPYSHTPAHAGAQQPGMTGQVKEEIITRFGELGVYPEKGSLRFDPHLITEPEWASENNTFAYYDVSGRECRMDIKPGQMAFTFCQVPVVYEKGSKQAITITYADCEKKAMACDHSGGSCSLDRESTLSLIMRSGAIERIDVTVAGN